MAQALKFGKGVWATKTGSSMAYNDQNGNYKPLPFNVERDSIATRVNKEGLIEVVGHDKLRIDYTDTDKGVALLEPQRTNYVKHSESIDNWSTGFSSLSPNAVTANYEQGPYSNTNADRVQLTINPSNTVSQIFQVLPITSGVHTVSVWLKSLSGTPTISIIDGYNTVGSFKLVTLTNEWVRHTLTFTTTASDFIPQFLLINGTTSSSADFLAYGFQVEQGSYPTSYIPTSGSTVQRAADVANNAGNSEVFNDSEGVLMLEISRLNKVDSSSEIISINDGSLSNYITLYYNSSGVTYTINFGSTEINGDFPISANNQANFNKIALKYKSQNTSLFVNGFEVDTNSGALALSGLNSLEFNHGNNAFDFYGKTKQIGYYDAVLTDSELEYLTSYRSLSELVKELNLNTL